MKKASYQIYSLSNPHFQDVEILTTKNEILKGQFVSFKVLEGDIEYLYPSEKYCFLPQEKRKLFMDNILLNNGAFKEFPEYIKQIGLNNILKIIIKPSMVV